MLRPPRPSDAAAFAASTRDPEIRLHSGVAERTEAEALAMIEALEGDDSALVRVIADPDTDAVLGQVVLYAIAEYDRRASLGFWLAAQARGRGVARRAVRQLVRLAEERGIVRLEAYSDVDNDRAHAVLRDAGFEQEARLRSYGQRDDGSRIDAFLFARVRG